MQATVRAEKGVASWMSQWASTSPWGLGPCVQEELL